MDRGALAARGLFTAGLAALLVTFAQGALADPLTLRSGATLEVARLDLLPRGVRVTLEPPGGTVQADLDFRELDPIAFLASPHAQGLDALQRERLELLARLVRRVKATEEARAQRAQAAAAPKPAPPGKPAAPPAAPAGRPAPPEAPPGGAVPPRGSYAEGRYRERRPDQPAPPSVPGRERPPLGGPSLPPR